MDAKALLQGMGWREGQGLGKSNQGISQAIKPKVQQDRNGLGLNPAASLVEPWWAKVFNQTAKNVAVKEAASDEIPKKKKRSLPPTDANDTEEFIGTTNKTKKKSKTNKESKTQNNGACESTASNSVDAHIASIRKSLYLGNFTRGVTLQSAENASESKADAQAIDDKPDEPYLNPIDEQLWKSCKGRTAHKGARYGVLKGKMARLVRQEQAMASNHCDKTR